MLDCISVANMRQSDADTIAQGISGVELISRAARAVYDAVNWHGKTVIAVGSGNNGADGYALACLLCEASIPCELIVVGKRVSDDGAVYAALAEKLGVPCRRYIPNVGCFEDCQIIVDCLLGTGFQGELRESYRNAIMEINESGGYVVSVDINSGLNGDTGEAELAVRSDLTVTIGYVKNGMVTENAGRYMKRLVCVDIGIGLTKEGNKICDEAQWQALGEPNQKLVVREGRTYYPCPPWLDMNRRKKDG